MADAVVILVLAVGANADPAAIEATKTGAATAVGEGARIIEGDASFTEADALLLGDMLGASSVAIVRWSNGRAGAFVGVHTKGEDWTASELRFGANEPLSERGRSVGLTIAALLPANVPSTPTPTPAKPPPPPPKPVVVAPVVRDVSPRTLTEYRLDAAASGLLTRGLAAAGARVAIGWGGTIDGHVAGTIRSASAPSLGEGLLQARLGLGSTWSFGSRPWSFSARVDGLLLWESVSRIVDNQSVRRARFLPGVEVVACLQRWVSADTAIGLGVGAELAFGITEVGAGTHTYGSIPPLRALTELGLETRF
ncbi:MAG: hypothetical protein ACXVEF_06545 [Polyangiales bacterium]